MRRRRSGVSNSARKKVKFRKGTQLSHVESQPQFCHIVINGLRCNTASRGGRSGTSRIDGYRGTFLVLAASAPRTGRMAFSHSTGPGSAVLAKVEVELKSVLKYMPFGVYTRPQLRRELKRCVELGKPWPLVLAVIPPSNNRSRPFVSQVPSTSNGTLSWFSLARLSLKPSASSPA